MAVVRRSTAYVAASTALAAAVTSYAFYDRPNFYSAAVFLSQSSACLIILSNAALVYFAGFMYGLQLLLFGSLRPIEVEQLWERGWIAGTEWLFALSIFRDDFGVAYMTSFILLFVSKLWGWMVVGRLDILEQQNPANATKFHARLLAATIINLVLPLKMASYCFEEAMYGPKSGIMTMFTFEFGILFIGAVSTTLRYGLWCYEYRLIQKQMKERVAEIHREAAETGDPTLPTDDADVQDLDLPGWEAKGSFQFALDIGTDFLKLAAYLTFFGVLTVLYGLPIYIVRDLYMTARSFFNRVNDYRQYRNATRNMHNQYPDASAENLASDPTCIVCREDMKPWIGTLPVAEQAANRNSGNFSISERHRPKKLPCGHILHFSCLRSWLERQQACPTCRRSVLRPMVVPGQPTVPPVNGVPREPGQPGDGNPGARPVVRLARNARPVGWGFRLGPFRFFFGRFGGNPGGAGNGPVERAVQQHLRDAALNDAQRQRPRPDEMPAPSMPDFLPNVTGAEAANAASSAGAGAESGSALVGNDPVERFTRSLQTHSLHAHLTAIEHMIAQDVRSLNLAEQRIQTIHWLLAEVERARAEVATQQGLIQPIQLAPRMDNTQLPAVNANSASQVVLDHEGNVLTTLPQGWTVIPFQSANAVPGVSSSIAGPTPTSSAEPSGQTGEASRPLVNSETTMNILQPTPTQSLPFPFVSQQGAGLRTPSNASLSSSVPTQHETPSVLNGSLASQSETLENQSRKPSRDMSATNASQESTSQSHISNTNGIATQPTAPSIFNESSWSFNSLPQNGGTVAETSGPSNGGQNGNEGGKSRSLQPSVEDLDDEMD